MTLARNAADRVGSWVMHPTSGIIHHIFNYRYVDAKHVFTARCGVQMDRCHNPVIKFDNECSRCRLLYDEEYHNEELHKTEMPASSPPPRKEKTWYSESSTPKPITKTRKILERAQVTNTWMLNLQVLIGDGRSVTLNRHQLKALRDAMSAIEID